MEQQGSAVPPRPAKPAQGGPPARVHRAVGRPPPAPLPSPAPAPPVSLERPRPSAERRLNTYVEAPPRAPAARPPDRDKGRGAVTVQPSSAPAKHPERPPCAPPPDSIMCVRCGRCRCAQCARPRALPERWLCNSCLCSAETAIDYASCMCCVKALFYHCFEGDGDGDSSGSAYADEPCACSGSRQCLRWGYLAALSAVLPCLWCYWPLRGAAALGARAYAHTRPAGCRCRPRASDKLPLAPGPHY